MDRIDALLPCPFCGERVQLHLDDYINGRVVDDPECYIECPTPTCVFDYRDKYKHVDDLKLCWNTRSQIAPVSVTEDVTGLCGALRSGEQADMDGTLRGGFHRATADTIEAQAAEIARKDQIIANLHKVEKANRDTANEQFHRAEKAEADLARLTERDKMLAEALRPFAGFAEAGSFNKLPDDMPMTQGSRLARRQVTAGDFKRANAALADASKG